MRQGDSRVAKTTQDPNFHEIDVHISNDYFASNVCGSMKNTFLKWPIMCRADVKPFSLTHARSWARSIHPPPPYSSVTYVWCGRTKRLDYAPTIEHLWSEIIIIIIIIITNENIKVMLSRKRCRGTLQDYNKGEIVNVSQNYGRIKMSSAGVWMERGRKQFEEMMVDCSMHAVQRRGKHDHPG